MGRKDRHHGSPGHALCFLRGGHLGTPMYPLEPGRMKQAGRKISHVSQERKAAGGEVIVQGNENIFRFQKSQLIFLPTWSGERGRLRCSGMALADTQSLVLTLHGC